MNFAQVFIRHYAYTTSGALVLEFSDGCDDVFARTVVGSSNWRTDLSTVRQVPVIQGVAFGFHGLASERRGRVRCGVLRKFSDFLLSTRYSHRGDLKVCPFSPGPFLSLGCWHNVSQLQRSTGAFFLLPKPFVFHNSLS